MIILLGLRGLWNWTFSLTTPPRILPLTPSTKMASSDSLSSTEGRIWTNPDKRTIKMCPGMSCHWRLSNDSSRWVQYSGVYIVVWGEIHVILFRNTTNLKAEVLRCIIVKSPHTDILDHFKKINFSLPNFFLWKLEQLYFENEKNRSTLSFQTSSMRNQCFRNSILFRSQTARQCTGSNPLIVFQMKLLCGKKRTWLFRPLTACGNDRLEATVYLGAVTMRNVRAFLWLIFMADFKF